MQWERPTCPVPARHCCPTFYTRHFARASGVLRKMHCGSYLTEENMRFNVVWSKLPPSKWTNRDLKTALLAWELKALVTMVRTHMRPFTLAGWRWCMGVGKAWPRLRPWPATGPWTNFIYAPPNQSSSSSSEKSFPIYFGEEWRLPPLASCGSVTPRAIRKKGSFCNTNNDCLCIPSMGIQSVLSKGLRKNPTRTIQMCPRELCKLLCILFSKNHINRSKTD